MPFSTSLDLETLESAFQPAYFERGWRYARNGKVLMADMSPSRGMITGRVLGSAGRVYQCIVHLTARPDAGVELVGQCSCPVGYNCKHIAALLIVLAERQGVSAAPAKAKPAVPEGLLAWLDYGQRLAAERVAEGAPFGILYLLELQCFRGFWMTVVQAVKARRLRDGSWGKPQELSIAGRSRADFVTHVDRRILALVQAGLRFTGDSRKAGLGDETGADALEAIVRSGRGFLGSPEGPALSYAGPIRGRLDWSLGEDAKMHVALESERSGLTLLPVAPPWYVDPASGDCGPIEAQLDAQDAALLAAAPAVSPDVALALEQAARQRLAGSRLPMPKPPEPEPATVERPTPWLYLRSDDLAKADAVRHWGLPAQPRWAHAAWLRFDYGGAIVGPEDPVERLQRVDRGRLLVIDRSPAAEAAAIEVLERLGLRWARGADGTYGACFGLDDEPAWVELVRVSVPRLRGDGWHVEIDDDFRFRVAEIGDWEMDVDQPEGDRWLDVGLGIEVEGARIDLLPLLVRMIQSQGDALSPSALAGQDEDAEVPLRMDDGRLIVMPVKRLRPILATLVELYDPERPLSKAGRLRLSRMQGAQLAELEETDPDLRWRGGQQAREWGRRLKSFVRLETVEPPAALGAELRPYQRQGLSWLQFLREYGLGGILADDMGLGKTIQTLAHLLVETASGRADRPSLVIAPTSLMFNWRREAQRFAPSLKVLLAHGNDRRKHFGSFAEYDLVLTSYPLLPRDSEVLADQPWHLLILDEAQAIKNPRSKAAETVRGLEARHRLCLTGTPLENHLGELWALLDFLMPDMLGDERRFRRLFRQPIERHGDAERAEQLRRRLSPFLLRRTKDAVAADLPPKTEILREVPLGQEQRDLYEALRLSLHEKVRSEVERKGMSRSGIIILDALLKLRQVCCDPRLVRLESARRVKGSAKLELLMALLPELLQEGRRVLLFSQFTSMLDLIQAALGETGMREDSDFVKLTGRTRNRSLPVDRFQAGEVSLFLISLKAGGSGLNLTAADTVIHYDPWWNPAAERQATDRAHRIGQDKPVFVYKLLTEGTVEQRVAELQARKQSLADTMLAGGGAAAGSLSADDLDLLFAPIDD